MSKQSAATKKGTTLNKAIYVKVSAEFLEMLNESQWILKQKPSEIVRQAIMEYLEEHLPKEAKQKLLTQESENPEDTFKDILDKMFTA